MPLAWLFQYLPVNAISVPCWRSTRYCSGVSSFFHCSGVFSTFTIVSLDAAFWAGRAAGAPAWASVSNQSAAVRTASAAHQARMDLRGIGVLRVDGGGFCSVHHEYGAAPSLG